MADGLDMRRIDRVLDAMVRGMNDGDATLAEIYTIAATFYLTVRVNAIREITDPHVFEATRNGLRGFAAHLVALADAPTREAFLALADEDAARHDFKWRDAPRVD